MTSGLLVNQKILSTLPKAFGFGFFFARFKASRNARVTGAGLWVVPANLLRSFASGQRGSLSGTKTHKDFRNQLTFLRISSKFVGSREETL